ncbi:hypothetical protein ABW21_db0201896 [Orbilia brochopaga]|nr:hypothetical protein ABW21_db0201896 [Drechslerella brochopaga]
MRRFNGLLERDAREASSDQSAAGSRGLAARPAAAPPPALDANSPFKIAAQPHNIRPLAMISACSDKVDLGEQLDRSRTSSDACAALRASANTPPSRLNSTPKSKSHPIATLSISPDRAAAK